MIGYSEGTFITMYGLSSQQDYWADKVNRFISMATCTVNPGLDYDTEVAKYTTYDELGFYNVGGNDESTLDPVIACQFTNDLKMGCVDGEYVPPAGKGGDSKEGEEDISRTNAKSLKMGMFLAQVGIEKRW